MNVREVVEIVLELNGGRKFEKTCDQLLEGNWEHKSPVLLQRLWPPST